MSEQIVDRRPAGAPEAARTPASGRLHLAALDGIRGLASLYVVLGHAFLVYKGETAAVTPMEGGLSAQLGRWLDFPRLAVGVFIVLSGYCLMAPVARGAGPDGRGWRLDSFGGYVYRRARRILPPYYAALGLSLLGLWLVPELAAGAGRLWTGNFWGQAQNVTPSVLRSHVLMIFNWRHDWIFKINPPFWSVATEWQIYFLFPLLFLPLMRWTGRWALLVLAPVAFLVGFVPHQILARTDWTLSPGHPWYTGLFAMGMTAATVTLSPELGGVGRFIKKRGGLIFLAGLAGLAAIEMFTDWHNQKFVPCDLAYGVMAMGLLIVLTRGSVDAAADSTAARTCRKALATWPIKKLGDMSYSLYLTHAPILVFVHRWTAEAGWHTSGWRVLGIMMGMATPVAVVFAAGFHVLFERPFMSARKKAVPRVAPAGEAAKP